MRSDTDVAIRGIDWGTDLGLTRDSMVRVSLGCILDCLGNCIAQGQGARRTSSAPAACVCESATHCVAVAV